MRTKLAVQPWLLLLNLAAWLLLAAGLLSLHAPLLLPFDPLSKPAAWLSVAAGAVSLAAFWIVFLRSVKARHSGR
jgi:hypothetical protein